MGVKVKGGMWCPNCESKVLAQRNGHAVRNTVGAAATLGLALKTERWRCPNCGTPTQPRGMEGATSAEEGLLLLVGFGSIVGAILVGALVSPLAGFFAFWVFMVAGVIRLQKHTNVGLGAPAGRKTGQWRCAKNDHLLSEKYKKCPIDGSAVRQI